MSIILSAAFAASNLMQISYVSAWVLALTFHVGHNSFKIRESNNYSTERKKETKGRVEKLCLGHHGN